MLDTDWLGGLLDALDGGSRTDSHLTRRPHNSRDVGWFSENRLLGFGDHLFTLHTAQRGALQRG